MTQPAAPDSADWQRRWTIEAGSVTLRPVTRHIAQAVLDGEPITQTFENGALHDRIGQAMGFAIRDIDSGAAAVLPTVWLIVRRADGQIITGQMPGTAQGRTPGRGDSAVGSTETRFTTRRPQRRQEQWAVRAVSSRHL